jgi:hypothetical protein
MKSIRYLAVSILAAGMMSVTAIAPAHANSQVDSPRRSAEEIKQRVAAKTAKILRKLTELRPKIAGNERFSAAQKSILNADIDALLKAVSAARKAIAEDTTIAQIRADQPLLDALHVRRVKLHKDLAEIRAEVRGTA